MKIESLSPHLQDPATCPYLEPADPVRASHPTSRIFILMLSFPLRLVHPSTLLSLGFPTRTLYVSLLSVIGATSSAHLILLYLITVIIFGEEYRA